MNLKHYRTDELLLCVVLVGRATYKNHYYVFPRNVLVLKLPDWFLTLPDWFLTLPDYLYKAG